MYLSKVNTALAETVLNENEFQEAFKSFKWNKAPGHDGLNVDIITYVYEPIKKPLFKIFNESINLRLFQENMKIAKAHQFWNLPKKNY